MVRAHSPCSGSRCPTGGNCRLADRVYLLLARSGRFDARLPARAGYVAGSQGYVCTSDDGLHFGPIKAWQFEDGSELGNYNTQQHWVTHGVDLYLVYTRKGAHNDHVFRHRAPLFMAQVDTQQLAVKRATECVLVPEHGARLGNFAVAEVSENETWVTVAEWMQTWSPNVVLPPDNAFGADNRVYAARILWRR